MKIPKTLRIGFNDYEVEIKEHLEIGGNVLFGEIDFDSEKIYLNGKYTENQMNCTLVHEAIHGIDNFMGIGLTEEQIEKLGKGLYLFIRDNEEMLYNCEFECLEIEGYKQETTEEESHEI